jgi:tetratricopeptide (TPR) repeat protein
MPLAGGGGENSSSGGDDPQLNPRNPLVQQALLLRFTGRYSEAVSLLRSMVGNNSLSGNVRSWAVHQLFAVTQRLPGSNVASFLRSAAAQYPSLARDVRAILPRTYLYEGSSDSALSTFNANIQLYPNSAMERAALYGKFVHTMYTRRDTAASHTLHDQLLARYEGSLEATLVALQWNIQTGSPRLSISPPHLSAAGLPKSKVSQSNGLPTDFALGQNYPNPFNPSTTISYAVPADTHVRIKVYDVLGREALTLVDGPIQAGYHQVQCDGSGLASGVYLYRMESGHYVAVKKFLLLK